MARPTTAQPAAAPRPAPADAADGELLFVLLEGRRFAFRLDEVEEVLPLVEPVPVPTWPPYGLGLMDVHGAVVPLVDPRATLQLPVGPLSWRMKIVLLRVGGRHWGVLVSAVDGVRAAAVHELAEIAPQPRLVRPDVSHAFADDASGPVPVLDAGDLVEVLGLPPPPEPPGAGGPR